MKGVRIGRVMLAALLLAAARTAAAQVPQPIGPFAADVRVVFANFPDDPAIASGIGVDTATLPGRGRGLLIGGHFYPGRKGMVTFGVGAEWLRSRGTRSVPLSTDPPADGPEVRTTFSAFSPQVSLNFGGRQGWSYLTAGYGWATLGTDLVDAPLTDAGSVKMYNYGGGARWFAKEHVALSLDLRWYSVGAQAASGTRPDYPKTKLLVLSAGLSIK